MPYGRGRRRESPAPALLRRRRVRRFPDQPPGRQLARCSHNPPSLFDVAPTLLGGDLPCRAPRREPRRSARGGHHTGGAGPTWVCRFDHLEPADNRGLGACHGSEVPFVFRTEGHDGVRVRIGDHPSPTAATTAHEAWVSFAREGMPGWESYDTTRRPTALIAEKLAWSTTPPPTSVAPGTVSAKGSAGTTVMLCRRAAPPRARAVRGCSLSAPDFANAAQGTLRGCAYAVDGP